MYWLLCLKYKLRSMSNQLPEKKSPSLREDPGEKYHLKLFIAGILPNSSRAIENIQAICEKYLKGRHKLEIIDIYQQPDLARTEKILAIPVLVKKWPLPEGRMIGDLSDTDLVLKELNVSKI